MQTICGGRLAVHFRLLTSCNQPMVPTGQPCACRSSPLLTAWSGTDAQSLNPGCHRCQIHALACRHALVPRQVQDNLPGPPRIPRGPQLIRWTATSVHQGDFPEGKLKRPAYETCLSASISWRQPTMTSFMAGNSCVAKSAIHFSNLARVVPSSHPTPRSDSSRI